MVYLVWSWTFQKLTFWDTLLYMYTYTTDAVRLLFCIWLRLVRGLDPALCC